MMHCSILLRRCRCFAIAHHHRRPGRCSSHSAASLRYDRDTGIVYSNGRPIYQTIIGIEVHAQLDVATKLFSCAPRITSVSSRHRRRHRPTNRRENGNIVNNDFVGSGGPNTHVHAYDLAYPGSLPAPPSQDILHSAILACAVLNCNIHQVSRFERKHYFYPDLPQGYQITQQRWPLATNGFVSFVSHGNNHTVTNIQQQSQQGDDDASVDVTPKKKQRRRGVGNIVVDSNVNDSGNTVYDNSKQHSNEPTKNTRNTITLRIERIQLEQDTGKTTTIITSSNAEEEEEEEADGTMQQTSTTSQTHSLIDYNRAGCALIEIVSYPDLRSASEAAAAVERIRTLLRHVGSCDGRMEEGSLRCDLNVSIAPIEETSSDNDLSLQTLQVLSDDTRIGKEDLFRLRLPPNTGHRVEVKNLNSLRQIVAAAEYEALRQSELALLHTPTRRETRTFHVKPTSQLYPLGGETYCIRSKGDAVDYRFMPEPDLPPLILDEETLGIKEMSSSMVCPIQDHVERYMPESIESTQLRLVNDYGLTEDVARIITSDPPAIILFEEAVTFAIGEFRSMTNNMDDDNVILQSLPTMVANCLSNDLYALIKKSAAIKCSAAAGRREGVNDDDDNNNIDDGAYVTTSTLDHPISVEYTYIDGHRLGALVAMVANGMLTSSMAKKVLAVMYDDNGQASKESNKESKTSSSLRGGFSHPNDIANQYGWRIISDWDILVQFCDGVVNDPQHSTQLELYKMGDERKRWKIDKFYVGKIMAASNGNAHPERMKEALAFVLSKAN